MKKITSLLLTASMVAVLTGCSVPGLGSNNSSSSDIPSYLTNSADNSTNSRDSDSTDSRETDSKDTDATDSNASADSKDSADSETYTEPEVGYPDEYGDAMGGLGDTMHTAFFEYTVNSAYLCEQYEGYEPAEGKVLLVADVTVHNPYKSSVPMYDTDFQVQWDSDEDDAYDYPITFYLE